MCVFTQWFIVRLLKKRLLFGSLNYCFIQHNLFSLFFRKISPLQIRLSEDYFILYITILYFQTIFFREIDDFLIYNYAPMYTGSRKVDWTFEQAYLFQNIYESIFFLFNNQFTNISFFQLIFFYFISCVVDVINK